MKYFYFKYETKYQIDCVYKMFKFLNRYTYKPTTKIGITYLTITQRILFRFESKNPTKSVTQKKRRDYY